MSRDYKSDYGPWPSENGRFGVQMRANRRRYIKRKQAMAQLKVDRGCDKCGYNACYAALEWHHRPGTVKRGSIGENILRRDEWVIEEMAKCDLLCSNCHREITHEQREPGNSSAAANGIAVQHPQLFGDDAA